MPRLKTKISHGGSEIGYLRSGSYMVPKYFSFHVHLLSHLPSRRQGELLQLSRLFRSWQQAPIFLIIAFCCAISARVFSFGSVHFCCSCWLCLLFLLAPLLLTIFHHSFSLLNYVFLFSFLLSFFFLGCMFFVPVIFLSSSCLFSFSCVSFSDSPMFFLFSCWQASVLLFCVSCLIVLALCLFLLVPLVLIFGFFFFPSPRAHLKRKTMERTTI